MVRHIATGLALGFALFGCATFAFTYKFYGLDAVSYDGSLLGPKPAQDLSFKVCEPDKPDPTKPAEPVKGKCVVMLASEFFKLKGDFQSLETRLRRCEGPR